MRGQNALLRGLLSEAEWTEDELARRVNALGVEIGVSLRLDRRSVTHWLAGRRPRPPIPELLAEALGRRLRQRVSLAEIGLERAGAAGPATDESEHADPSETLVRLGELAARGSRARADLAYSVAGLNVSGWQGADEALRVSRTGRAARPDHGPGSLLDAKRVGAVERMAGMFSTADSAFGGGASRIALAEYLSYDIVPRLRAPAPARLRTRMYSAATELTYLCGFMCFDDEKHAEAQSYYLAALELARTNRDAASYAIVLRALSVQADALGQSGHALSLAQSALSGAGAARLPAARLAFLYGQVAVAAAAEGDSAAAVKAMNEAEHRLTSEPSAGANSVPMGNYHRAALAHQEAEVLVHLGDRAGAIRLLTASIRRRPATERRSRAVTLAKLAGLHLDSGHVDEALAIAHEFLDDYGHLDSRRAETAFRSLRARLRPHAGYSAARQYLVRAAEFTLPTVKCA